MASSLKNLTRLVRNAVEAREPQDKFLDELNMTMSTIDKREQRVPSKTYKPSSLGGCKRNMYFQVTGATQDDTRTDSGLIGICETGSARHEILQTWVSRMHECGFNCHWLDVEEYLKLNPVTGTIVRHKSGMETKCYNEVLNMSFLCDGLIEFDDEKYILEIKTEDNFKNMKRVAPEPKHIIQATAYSVCLGINKIIFIYENRNYCTRKAFLVQVTDQMKNDLVVSEIEEVQSYVDSNQVPPKTDNSKECNYCDYKKECRKWG